MQKEITGYFKREIYFHEGNEYLVGLVQVTRSNIESKLFNDYFSSDTITVVGNMPRLLKNELYHFYGEVVKSNYGMQFSVFSYELERKSDANSVVEFLSSELFKGIGKKTARKIVNQLGDDAIDKILKDKAVLNQFKLSENSKTMIYDVLLVNYASEKIIRFLLKHGFGAKLANKIFKKYGGNTMRIIEENPYKLIDDIEGIGFKRADSLALAMNFDIKSPYRVQAAIKYIFEEMCFNEGFTYITHKQLIEKAKKFLNENSVVLTDSEIMINVTTLIENKKIIEEKERLFLPNLYQAEAQIAQKIHTLLNEKTKEYKDVVEVVQDVEHEIKINYTPKQKEAIINGLKNKITIITGGPGTGKTTIVNGIIKSYIKLNQLKPNQIASTIALVAPTGRAAKRLKETTGLEASTIHRLLGYQVTGVFTYDEHNRLGHQLIICDESSMVDVLLASNLLNALPNYIQIIFVGDINQLPSVGPGEVLKDLIQSCTIPTIKLDVIHRQTNDSSIIKLAHEINQGLIADDLTTKQKDRNFIRCDNSQVLENIEFIVSNAITKEFTIENTQVLAPMYKGPVGIDNINNHLQNCLNPKNDEKKEITYFNKVFRVNDKVIQLVNRPEDNVMNGDIGYIQSIKVDDEKENTIIVDFDSSLVEYTEENLNELALAYCISIHKSQGSEFDIVIVVLSKSYSIMLRRKLIYTAVTRAKKYLILIGDVNAYTIAVNNTNETIRQTSLKEKLQALFQTNIIKIDDFEFKITKSDKTPYDFLD